MNRKQFSGKVIFQGRDLAEHSQTGRITFKPRIKVKWRMLQEQAEEQSRFDGMRNDSSITVNSKPSCRKTMGLMR